LIHFYKSFCISVMKYGSEIDKSLTVS